MNGPAPESHAGLGSYGGNDLIAAELQPALTALLKSYSAALKFAGDLPSIGRCRVRVAAADAAEIDRGVPEEKFTEKRRWVARVPTRLYVETHIRRQLRHIARCLEDELLHQPRDAKQLTDMKTHLEQNTGRFLSWGRLKDLFVGIPPVAAALTALAAALSRPFEGIDRRTLAVLATAAALTYFLFIWPSVRLGFRAKRAIFSGGVDQPHPMRYRPGEIRWVGFPPPSEITPETGIDKGLKSIEEFLSSVPARIRARRSTGSPEQRIAREDKTSHAGPGTKPAESNPDVPRGSGPRLEFSPISVYQDENRVFELLHRRKRPEPPLDMLLSFGPYLLLLAGITLPVLYIDYLTGGRAEAAPAVANGWGVLMLLLVVVQTGLQARRNYRLRIERWHRA